MMNQMKKIIMKKIIRKEKQKNKQNQNQKKQKKSNATTLIL